MSEAQIIMAAIFLYLLLRWAKNRFDKKDEPEEFHIHNGYGGRDGRDHPKVRRVLETIRGGRNGENATWDALDDIPIILVKNLTVNGESVAGTIRLDPDVIYIDLSVVEDNSEYVVAGIIFHEYHHIISRDSVYSEESEEAAYEFSGLMLDIVYGDLS